MKALIVGSGDFNNSETILKYNKLGYTIIAADGGADILYKLKILPNVSIGDYDSIKAISYQWLKDNKINMLEYPSKKNKTDMELCLDYAIENCSDTIIITGGTGFRLDHTLANMMMMVEYHKRQINIIMEDDYNKIFVISGDNRIETTQNIGSNISVIPVGNSIDNVELKGLEYFSDNLKLPFGSSLGVSNVIVDSIIEINVNIGVAFAIISRDKIN